MTAQPLQPTTVVSHPVIVICIAAYNEERFIARTIESIRQQTWSDFAVLISDNASSDSTQQVVAEAIKGDSRFHYVRQATNIGSARNGDFLQHATASPFVMWLGAHDLLVPDFLEQHLTALFADPRLSLSFGHTGWIDEDDCMFNVTRGWMAEMPPLGIVRYALTPKKNDLCSEINNVIRREFLEGFEMLPVWGLDNIMLAHLAYHGPMHCVAKPMLLRRVINRPAESYMARLTGNAQLIEDKSAFIEALIDHLRRIARWHPLRPLASPLIRHWLRYRYGISKTGPAALFFGLLEQCKAQVRRLRPARRAP